MSTRTDYVARTALGVTIATFASRDGTRKERRRKARRASGETTRTNRHRSSEPLTAEWLEDRIEYDVNGGCWLWRLHRNAAGYGETTIGSATVKAHRLSWQIFNGDIPSGLYVCHKCDVRACVNPGHLFLGTARDNTLDMIAKGRNQPLRGERANGAKLTTSDVVAIRKEAADGATSRALAAKYGVSPTQIQGLVKGKTWACVSGARLGNHLPRGERHHAARLTEDDVREIRRSSERVVILAKKYGVSVSNIGMIKQGKRWGHVQ